MRLKRKIDKLNIWNTMDKENYRLNYEQILEIINTNLMNCVNGKKPELLYEPVDYILLGGGKRIRPVLAMICCGSFCGIPEKALQSALAIEILHNFTLLHDDIMDKSPLRRGRQTVHLKWNESAAILSGDVMAGIAFDLLPSPEENPNSYHLFKALTEALIKVCEGQSLDMEFETMLNVSMPQYFEMIGLKTAKLIETSCVMGGLSANENSLDLEILRKFGYNIGMAFQIQDDILDITSRQELFGKKIGQDLIDGKKTYLFIKAEELAKSKQDIDLINYFINNKGIKEENVPKFRELYDKLEILETAYNEVARFSGEAHNLLQNFERNKYTEMLEILVESLSKRVY